MLKVKIPQTLGILVILIFSWKGEIVIAQSGDWPMAGQNPQRTSKNTVEINATLSPAWYKIFKDAYITQRTQIIAANNTLFVSTSRGLYALDPGNGNQKWYYPTEMPLGDSPTYANGNVYVGGFDRKIHAINASTGQAVWTYWDSDTDSDPGVVTAGFQVSPLVVNGTVYAGNRNGYFYAIDAGNGSFKWKFKTEAPITYSAAYDNGVIYFASNDGYAYALTETGGLKWKSAKLPGSGFTSWWPVMAGNYVVFVGGENYRTIGPGVSGSVSNEFEKVDVWGSSNSTGATVGPTVTGQTWANGATVLDLSKSNSGTTPVTKYLADKSWRRTVFVLDKNTGVEKTYNFNNLGKPEYAPFLWFGTYSGNRYPPIYDDRNGGILYMSNSIWYDSSIPRGQIVGWKIDSQYVSVPATDKNAVDEPQGYAMGGNLIYWNRCCDRVGRAFSVTNVGTQYTYFNENLDNDIIPGYNSEYWNPDTLYLTGKNAYESPFATYGAGGKNGIYGNHGDTAAPIPYQDKVYFHRSNVVIAFSQAGGKQQSQTSIQTVANADKQPSPASLKAKLASELQKVVSAGHLRPGYLGHSIFDRPMNQKRCNPWENDLMIDYFTAPADTFYALSLAIPFLDEPLKTQTLNYLNSEYTIYPPYSTSEIGWQGAARELTLPPNDVASALTGGKVSGSAHPFAFYALWKYAQVKGGAAEIFNAAKNSFPTVQTNTEFAFGMNASLSGLRGYMELEKLAGATSSISQSSKYSQYTSLISSRASSFTKDSPWQDETLMSPKRKGYCRTMNVATNFLYMTPEVANDLLNQSGFSTKAQTALNEYFKIAPLWFVPKHEGTVGEGVFQLLYDYPALFAAKAFILKQPYSELVKYIDAPAFPIGDMFYIQNLAIALAASGTPPSSLPSPSGSFAKGDVNHDGSVNYLDMRMVLTNFSSSTGSLPNYFDPVTDAKVNILDGGHIVRDL